jgi:hypothetical protein
MFRLIITSMQSFLLSKHLVSEQEILNMYDVPVYVSINYVNAVITTIQMKNVEETASSDSKEEKTASLYRIVGLFLPFAFIFGSLGPTHAFTLLVVSIFSTNLGIIREQ